MPELLIGSSNPGKQAEIAALLARHGVSLLTPQQLGLQIEIEETGSNYRQNAALKARGYAQAAGRWTLADDTGLEVDALHGQPGLHSARFGPSAPERLARLLDELREHPRPWTARFRAVVALAGPQDELEFGSGECAGEIIPEQRGQGGFGYDPIFLVAGTGRTMAELSMAEKNQLSHRARAVQQLLPVILERLQTNGG